MRHHLPISRLREVLTYDPQTGVFRWAAPRQKCAVGAIAGRTDNRGYWRITVDGCVYLAHQLAWFYVYGAWPEATIDHRDLDKRNNSISNLRLATHSQNRANVPARRNNKSGLKGVTWRQDREMWRANCHIDGRQTHLGYFHTKEEAHAAYRHAATSHFGEFARA